MERTVVITGGAGGLGRETAREIASAGGGWRVVLVDREQDRAEAAAARLEKETGGKVVAVKVDLASLEEVRRFVRELPGLGLPPVHGVVCNAGVSHSEGGLHYSRDGFEETFAVNYLAHFVLVNELLPQLAERARIVFVSSSTHDPEQSTGAPAPRYADVATLAHPAETETGKEDGRRRYTTSKLCLVMAAYELARRLGDGTITANAFDPGLMPGTGLAGGRGTLYRFMWRYILPLLILLPINAHTPRTSGRHLARLILDPSLDGVTGRYFEGPQERRSSQESYDEAQAAELWTGSAALTGLGPTI
ncbi:SDR family NAD(P)-dependent oxidoreductase [Actinocorallia sp. B10E7]|uniref:SDR family NAD(P)-dependent oxidoreductase n=1 Tax=Actinocorallia sp. B10E7 TaxID=3153558 RepID=UPI00325D8D4F